MLCCIDTCGRQWVTWETTFQTRHPLLAGTCHYEAPQIPMPTYPQALKGPEYNFIHSLILIVCYCQCFVPILLLTNTEYVFTSEICLCAYTADFINNIPTVLYIYVCIHVHVDY